MTTGNLNIIVSFSAVAEKRLWITELGTVQCSGQINVFRMVALGLILS